jgi:uncharacterized membrane-anchored protein
VSFVEFTGHARLDRRTKNLTKRVGPDDVAIIDHADLDRVSAEELVESGVRVVVNVAASATGRFPNPGPLQLVRGGVRLIDAPGADLFDTVSDGELLSVRGAGLYRNGTCLAQGQMLGEHDLERALNDQRARVTGALQAFAENTLEYLRDEGRILTEGVELPALATRLRDRHVLVVARGPGHKRDLRMVGAYVRDYRPVLIGVDGGADAIVAVGTHFNLIEFLERDREGMSSTFVTRLKVGEILVDAKGVSRLVAPRVGLWPLVVLALAGLLAIVVAIMASPALRSVIEDLARNLL